VNRYVDTPYGPVLGCPDCDTWLIGGALLCEHGVTVSQPIEVTFTMTFEDPVIWRRLLTGGP